LETAGGKAKLGAWAGDAGEGTSEDTGKKQLSKGYSPSRDHRLEGTCWDMEGT